MIKPITPSEIIDGRIKDFQEEIDSCTAFINKLLSRNFDGIRPVKIKYGTLYERYETKVIRASLNRFHEDSWTVSFSKFGWTVVFTPL